MISLAIGIIIFSVLVVGIVHGDMSFGVMFVLACIMFTMFGRYAHRQRQIDLTREQLEYYKKKNQEEKEEE